MNTKMELKATGIVRRVDDLGRIVIPKETRRRLGIKVGDPVEMYTTENGIYMEKYHNSEAITNYTAAIKEIIRDDLDVAPCVKAQLLGLAAAFENALADAEHGGEEE